MKKHNFYFCYICYNYKNVISLKNDYFILFNISYGAVYFHPKQLKLIFLLCHD